VAGRADVRVVGLDLSDAQGWRDAQRLEAELARAARVPTATLQQIPPGLFTPTGYFVGDESVTRELERLAAGDGSGLRTFEAPSSSGEGRLSPAANGAIALAGLADGLNPCALAGLAFLLAYLLHSGLGRRPVVVVGLLFAGGTFAAYFAAGLGLYFAIAGSSSLPAGRLLTYGVACVCCTIFATVAWHAVAMGPSAAHAVSDDTRRLEHGLVRMWSRPALLWVGAPILGASFAVLELACTGQLYLPAIAVMAREGQLVQALRGLALYNACFVIAPLALTAAVASAGRALTAPRFGALTARGRLATACALTALALYMVQEVRRVAGTL